MKRFLALLLLLTLLPAVPALGEEKIDVPAVILEDTWVNDDYTMAFSADGTAVMTYKDITHEGTWEYVNDMVYFRYQQYGDQTIKLSMTQKDGIYLLSSNYFQLQMKAVRERNEQEAKETAEKKQVDLAWGDEVTLDFMSFSFTGAKILRSPYQIIDDYPQNYYYSQVKGKKYLLVYGSVKNPDQNERWLNRIRAEVVLDEKDTYKMDVYAIGKGDTYLNSILTKNAAGKLVLSAELPEEAAASFTTAQVRFSLDNYLAGTPQKEFEGDFFFSLNIDEAGVKSARKGVSRKKVFFEVGKNKSVPKPSSYMDAVEEEGGIYQLLYPATGKVVNAKEYYIRSRFDGETPAELVKAYVKKLKDEGLTVTKLDGKKAKDPRDGVTYYLILKGKTPLGWIELREGSNYSANLEIIKK